MDKPTRPTAPTKPIKPKLAFPMTKPTKAKPVHNIATLKIIVASLKELSAEIRAIIIKIKNIAAEEKICACDSDLDSASTESSNCYPGGKDSLNLSMEVLM